MKHNEKRKQILMTAMKLFSVKSYHQTSMKEIADTCEMSKGSLYIYFKSKEELLLQIFKYYFQLVDEQMIFIDQDDHLSLKEKLTKTVEVQLKLAIEYHEFYRMQMQEIIGLKSDVIKEYIRTKNVEQTEWLKNYLIGIYGSEIEPYALDCLLLLTGMISAFINLITIEKLSVDLAYLPRFLIKKFDFLVEGILKEKGKPIINDLWPIHNKELFEEKQHPLVIIKEIKESIKKISLDKNKLKEALQSLEILEHELMEMEPRPAMIKGMLRNLAEVNELEAAREKLSQALNIDSSY